MAFKIPALPAIAKNLSPVWTHSTEILVEKALGSWIYAAGGSKFLDFTCGIAVTNTGHCHPRVVEAIREQAGSILHAQANIVYHKPMLNLVERLQKQVPKQLDTFFFSNSGAEAIEASIKLARHATGRTNIISFQGSFHGRTIGAMTITNSKTVYRVGYQPLMAGTFAIPYAYCHRCPVRRAVARKDPSDKSVQTGCSEFECCNQPLEELKVLFKQQCAPQDTAAIVIEPILGEGGYVVPSESFMTGLRQICDQYGILLIADEVQTGFGRTGKFFGYEHFPIVPDVLVMAKGIGSGLPLSGLIARRELMDKWVPGSHGGTYGGNALACAAACATVDVIVEEKLCENAVTRGAQLFEGIRRLQAKYPVISDVRGKGLMIGVEFDDAIMPYGFSGQFTKKCLSHGMMLLTTSCFESIRMIPPLTVSAEEIDICLDIMDKSLAELMASGAHVKK